MRLRSSSWLRNLQAGAILNTAIPSTLLLPPVSANVAYWPFASLSAMQRHVCCRVRSGLEIDRLIVGVDPTATWDRPQPSGILKSCDKRDSGRRQPSGRHASLSRYFSPSLAQRLANDAAAIDLGGQRREIAMLFTDIANFTTLVETLEPDVLGPLLNEYVVGMTDVVFGYDGTVTKIVGDAIHVLFGAPGEQPDHAARAVACALALDEYAQAFRERWRQKGIALGVTRIGAHAGPAIVGNFGGGRFFDYTAYGDTINVASRLEAVNKQLGTRVCVSATLVARMSEFRGRPVGDLILRGRTEALRAFEPLRLEQYQRFRHGNLFGGICQTRSGRSRCDGGLCGACRETRRRSTRQLSPQTAVEWCNWHTDRHGLERWYPLNGSRGCLLLGDRLPVESSRICCSA